MPIFKDFHNKYKVKARNSLGILENWDIENSKIFIFLFLYVLAEN